MCTICYRNAYATQWNYVVRFAMKMLMPPVWNSARRYLNHLVANYVGLVIRNIVVRKLIGYSFQNNPSIIIGT